MIAHIYHTGLVGNVVHDGIGPVKPGDVPHLQIWMPTPDDDIVHVATVALSQPLFACRVDGSDESATGESITEVLLDIGISGAIDNVSWTWGGVMAAALCDKPNGEVDE